MHIRIHTRIPRTDWAYKHDPRLWELPGLAWYLLLSWRYERVRKVRIVWGAES